ncbi:hypothetical protein ACFVZH_38455 [Streptomyces sp. NPDC059534]|uniref:hypothetical protein n=1 Tax=Streptomyces sp. NPDC059534 TaxID=3346859 RepID=UPI0036BF6A39
MCEAELLLDGRVVGYRRARPGRRTPVIVLAAELPHDPPQPFAITLHTAPAADQPTCVLQIAGQKYPVPETPPRRNTPAQTLAALTLHQARLRALLRRDRRHGEAEAAPFPQRTGVMRPGRGG